MSPLNQTLLTVVEILLIITLPVVLLAAIQYVRLSSARLRNETRDSEHTAITDVVRTAVAAAEQSGVLESLVGPEKKERALAMAQNFLRERGINIDLTQLSDFIEAEVFNQQRAGETGASATPADRQALISNAVETAVLAAEQSGLKGFIQNVGTDKKEYAVRLATQFLEANGIEVDPEVLGGLIEGQLMRLFLSARGQMPASGSR